MIWNVPQRATPECAGSTAECVPLYEKSVFINCPFDDVYEPLFHAVVLVVTALGFTPRCARESEGEADARIVRISRGLMACKYSIHDLSRFQGEGPENLARFNMPLELGIALGLRAIREGTATPHNWVVLVPQNFVHHKFVSDLAGFDVPDHDALPATIIRKVAAWLSLQPDFTPPVPTARLIHESYPGFQAALGRVRADALGSLTWPQIVRTAVDVVRDLPTV